MNYYRLYNPIRPTFRPHAEWFLLRPLSTTSVRRTTLGYGDMWDKKDNRPDHGEFRENKSPNDKKAQGNQAQTQPQQQEQAQAQPQQQEQQDQQTQKQREQDKQQGLQSRKDGPTNHSMLLEHDKVDKEEYVAGDFWAGDVGGKRGKHGEFLEVCKESSFWITRATGPEHRQTFNFPRSRFLQIDDIALEKIARDRAATNAGHFPTDDDVGSRQ